MDKIRKLTGYFAYQAQARLEDQIRAIDAELSSRKAQERLF